MLIVILIINIFFYNINGAITLPNFIKDSIVLQRDGIGARINGKANSNTLVTAKIYDQSFTVIETQTTTSDGSGFWVIRFNPREGSLTPYLIEFDDGGASYFLNDVVWGDVFHCSGQSNMERPLGRQEGGVGDTQQSDLHPFDNIRWISAKAFNDKPNQQQLNWDSGTRETAGTWCKGTITGTSCYKDGQSSGQGKVGDGYPSSVCSYMAITYSTVIGNTIPIGMFITAKGGAGIVIFMSPNSILDTSPAGGTCGGTDLTPLGSDPESESSVVNAYYNGVLYPMRYMVYKAFFWYQGEKDGQTSTSLNQYPCEQAAMFADIRSYTEQPDLSFFVTELTGFDTGSDYPAMRIAQRSISSLSNAYSIVSVDQGYKNDVHSPFKKQLGIRHANKFMKNVLGYAVNSDSPIYKSHELQGENLIVTFNIDNTSLATNMLLEDGTNCNNGQSTIFQCCSSYTNFLLYTGSVYVDAPLAAFTAFTEDSITIDLNQVSGITSSTFSGIKHMDSDFSGCALKANYFCFAGTIPVEPFSLLFASEA